MCNVPANDGDVPTTRSQNKHYWFYLHFCKPYNNETWPDEKSVCSELTLQVILSSLPLAHVTNINGFISNFISPITIKLDKILDQRALS